MAEKAYLLVRFNTRTVPPVVTAATVSSTPLMQYTITGIEPTQWVELFHVRGNTFAQAEEKLLRMVQGLEPCPFGSLKFLWMFLDPSEEAHRKRYELYRRIREVVATLSPKPSEKAEELSMEDHPASRL